MKILIFLSRDEYVRNYLQTDALSTLSGHEILFLLSDKCKNRKPAEGKPGFLGILPSDPASEKKQYELFNFLMWRHRKRSRTFYYRFSRFYKTFRLPGLKNRLLNLRGRLQAAKYVLLGNRVLGPIVIPALIRGIPASQGLARILEQAKPDLVVFPSSAYDPLGNDLVRTARPRGIKTLFVIDNWDNLSSKSIFWAPPDFLGVWGEQSRQHAIRIHGIDPSRVQNIGTPRFQSYYEVDPAKVTSHYPFEYILFCGVALAFDELGALKRLDAEISAHPEVYGGLKIVYRPHPYRHARFCPDVFKEEDFKNVVIDKQVRDAYYRTDSDFHPALDYYPVLLSKARLVVCPLTTMLIESLLCGTQVLAITYDDKIHYTSPMFAYKYYLHFEGIERIKGLNFAGRAEALGEDMRRLISDAPTVTRAGIFESLNHFIFSDDRPYKARLGNLVESALQSK
jgi:hypothetical protein